MRLREFDLDRPEVDRETRKEFRWSIRSVCALYARLFPGLDVPKGWKVLAECVERVDRPDPLDQLGVWCIQVPFDHAAHGAADARRRKEMTLDALQAGVLRVAASKGWPVAPFEMAYEAVVAHGYINEWEWPTPKASPSRRLRAALACVHDEGRFRAWMVVRDRAGNELARALAVDEPPNEFLFVPKLGRVAWVGEDRVVLVDKSGREVAGLSVRGTVTGET